MLSEIRLDFQNVDVVVLSTDRQADCVSLSQTREVSQVDFQSICLESDCRHHLSKTDAISLVTTAPFDANQSKACLHFSWVREINESRLVGLDSDKASLWKVQIQVNDDHLPIPQFQMVEKLLFTLTMEHQKSHFGGVLPKMEG